jgi:hypothetical protein
MKNDTLEFVDYVKIIWKQKVIVVVVTFICVIAGVVAVIRKPEILDKYRAVATIQVGKVANPNGGLRPVDSTLNLAVYIPKVYGNDVSLYSLKAEHVERTNIIRVINVGPDSEGTRKHLDEVVNSIIHEHKMIIDGSFQPFIAFLETQRSDILVLQNEIASLEEDYGNYEGGKNKVALISLIDSKNGIIREHSIDIFSYEKIINQRERCMTKLVGGTVVEFLPAASKSMKKIVGAGFAGFMFSIFLVLCIEYLRKDSIRRED